MGDYPTDLLGWADEMDRSADGCREAGFPQVVEEGNRFLAKLLRQAAAENAKMRKRLHHPCEGCPGCSSNDCPDALDVAQIDLAQLRGEHEKLRARVGWLDLLDTEEGRRTYADEALRVDLGAARAENAALRKAALEVFYNSVTNCECTTVRESDMIALGEVLGVYGVQAKPAENGAGGA